MIAKLYSLLFYANVDPVDFERCHPDIQKSNRRKLNTYLSISCCFLTAMLLLSFFSKTLRRNNITYLVALGVCAGLLFLSRALPRKNGLFLTWEMYAFQAAIYAFGIYLGVMRNQDQPATSFVTFLMAVPLVFVMRPIQIIPNVALFDFAFLIFTNLLKGPNIAAMDSINGVMFGLLSSIMSTYVMVTMYDNFVVRSKLRQVAENDLSTGLKNRNAYEEKVRDYPVHCSNTLSCIYVDVNNLHELNNTQGHAAGDRMLKIVGRSLQAIFGENDTYRVGGDEFIAFAIDRPAAEVRRLVQQFIDAVETQGYSVAVGVTTQSAGGIDVDALVKLAEQRMYVDKSDHYKRISHVR